MVMTSKPGDKTQESSMPKDTRWLSWPQMSSKPSSQMLSPSTPSSPTVVSTWTGDSTQMDHMMSTSQTMMPRESSKSSTNSPRTSEPSLNQESPETKEDSRNSPSTPQLPRDSDTNSWMTSTSTPAKTLRREPWNSLPTSSKCSVTAHTSEECSRPSRKCTISLERERSLRPRCRRMG